MSVAGPKDLSGHEWGSAGAPPCLLGDSVAIRRVRRMVDGLAAADGSVILRGERGTGKEPVARVLHARSPRARQPFIKVPCAGAPEDLLEDSLFGGAEAVTGPRDRDREGGQLAAAAGGSVLLVGIDELSSRLQNRLLHVLLARGSGAAGRDGVRPARIMVTTRLAPGELIVGRRFRADLFDTLNDATVVMPPLRERGDDVIQVAEAVLTVESASFKRDLAGFTDDALRAISGHAWPGNVRELQNRVKRAVLTADGAWIRPHDLELEPTDDPSRAVDLKAVRSEAVSGALQRALAETRGNVSRAARLLGVSRPTLYDLMRQHGLRD